MKVPPKVRDAVLERDGAKCMRCAVSVLNIPSSIHHRLPRRMGGTRDVRSYDVRNLVLLCTLGCHEEIESNRSLAYDTGWLVRSYDDLDTPMISLDGRRIQLYADDPWRVDVIDAASLLAAAAMA